KRTRRRVMELLPFHSRCPRGSVALDQDNDELTILPVGACIDLRLESEHGDAHRRSTVRCHGCGIPDRGLLIVVYGVMKSPEQVEKEREQEELEWEMREFFRRQNELNWDTSS